MMKFPGLKNSLRLAVAATSVCVLVPAAWGQGIGLRTLDDLMVSTPQKLERGKKLWATNCVSCHGAQAAGDGPQAQGVPNLQVAEYKYGGGPLQVFNAIAKGEHEHPVSDKLAYQDQWAVTHYLRSLGPTQALVDPPQVLTRAQFEAKEGSCNPTVKAGINDKMKFQGDGQIAAGQKAFASNCAACHGAEGKGDGAAAAALNPTPRNFTAGEGWTKGTSALAVFNSITNGSEGTAMAGFKHLAESDRWALTHLIREKWLPAGAKAEASDDEVDAVCRALSSGGASNVSISIESAMKVLTEDVEEERFIRMKRYGTAWVDSAANANRGQGVFEQHCQGCHGPRGVGATLGPYGAQPPYLTVKVNRLEPGLAGGTYVEFAKRSIGGAHVAIPDVTGASHIAASEWSALHAYVASFEGAGEVRPATERPEPTIETTPTDAAPADAVESTPPPKKPAIEVKPKAEPKPEPAAKAAPKEKPAEAASPE